jgi:hypothetical protein
MCSVDRLDAIEACQGGKVSILSKVYLLGGRSREPDKSAGLAFHASPSGRWYGEI